MLGAIAGDIIGSVHEGTGIKTKDFPLFVPQSQFTDDTVLTVAVADCLLTGASYVDKFHEYTRAYSNRGYGLRFLHWVHRGSREPYNSWGNGSAMRVSPVAFAFDTLEEVRSEARASAEVTQSSGRSAGSGSDRCSDIPCEAGRLEAGHPRSRGKAIRLRPEPHHSHHKTNV